MSFKPTKEQSKAIKAKDGAVLIIAGAGTGKTFTITQRIIHLVKDKDIDPGSILALTFTEKAAGEMVDRVERALPLGAPEIAIGTFHSFCDNLLKSEAINTGRSPDYKILTQSEEIYFLRKNLFNFDLKFYRPKGNPTKFLYSLSKYTSRLQDETVTPEVFEKYVNSQKGKVEQIEEEKLIELSNFYKSYSELKIKEDRVSFGDLIMNVLLLLRSRKDILSKYQKRYKYILVDEFQDTNYSQYEIIKLLTNYSDNPNLMVVADDDQSIYKFRGAAVSNVLTFTKDFPKAERIVLNENRRSVQEILDASYKLIQQNNPDRLEVKESIDKKLISKAEGLINLPEPVEARVYMKGEDEYEGIVREILDLTKQDATQQLDMLSKRDNIRFSDIAILVRSHNMLEEMSTFLKRSKIPFQFFGAKKLFNQGEIKELISYLRIILDYTDNISMNGVLGFDMWGLTEREIVEINMYASKRRIDIFNLLEEYEHTSEQKPFFTKISPLLDYIRESWKMMKDKESTWQILYKFVHESGYIKELSEEVERDEVVYDVTEEMQNEEKLKNISKFFDFINEFEKNNRNSTLYEFMDYLELVLGSGDSPMVEDSGFERKNAVNIITVHSSKGLEFPIVFIPGLARGRFPSDERSDQIEIPEDLITEILPEGDEHLQEERRLMYVAVTRAKSKAYISSANFYGTGKRKKKISPFMVEIFGEEKLLPMVETPIQFEEANDSQALVSEEEKSVAQKLKYISYSQIETYKMCPRKYKYRYILKIPTPQSAQLSYGNSMHITLKKFYEILENGGDVSFDTLKELFKSNWISAGYVNKEHEKESFITGIKSVKLFYDTFFSKEERPVFLEKSFFVKLGDYTINGKIDRIDRIKGESGDTYEIVDYKTGDSVKKQNDVDKNRQLVIYSLAAEKVFGIKADKLSLLFIDQNQKLTANNEKIEKLKEAVILEIGETAKKIESGDFRATPGFACKFCEYNKICKYAK